MVSRGRALDEEAPTWRERLAALRYVPPLMRLIWRTHRGYTLSMLVLRFARAFVPGGGKQIGDIYALRTLRPKGEIATRLATVIGPAEELFWRGFVQRRAGYVPATLAYGGVHLASGNLTLIGAASIVGAYWGLLRALGLSMEALIVSHVAWDIWIFLVAPTSPVEDTAPAPGERGSA